MLVMLARCGTLNVATPGPPYSNTLPTPPLTVSRRSNSRIISLAATQGCSAPASRTRTTRGIAT